MDGMEWMGSAMRAARAQLDVATHNLANASTDGYRRTAAALALTPRGLAVAERATDGQGAVRRTGRTFDLALLGPGAFRVGTGASRNGAFERDEDGWIVDGPGRDGGRIVDRLPLPRGTRVLAGALETSSVNPIGETLSILTAQRAFETAQKTMLAIDATREKAANDVVRVQ